MEEKRIEIEKILELLVERFEPEDYMLSKYIEREEKHYTFHNQTEAPEGHAEREAVLEYNRDKEKEIIGAVMKLLSTEAAEGDG